MPMSQQEKQLYIALQQKLGALTGGRQRFLQRMTPSNKKKIEIELARGGLEYELVAGMMSSLANSLPIELPSGPAFQELQESTAQLAKTVQLNAATDVLVETFDAVIDAWPKQDFG
jgi:hypothetical protein